MNLSQDDNLEYRIFLIACSICAFAAFGFIFIDGFIVHDYTSVIINIIIFIIFLVFYFWVKYKKVISKILIPFNIFLLIILLATWLASGGMIIANVFVALSILLIILIITPLAKLYIYLIPFLSITLFLFIFEFLHPLQDAPIRKNSQFFLANSIVILLGFFFISFTIILFKKRYNNERELIKNQNKKLDLSNTEIEAQNEKLIQSQEEIMVQRDFIEDKSKLLEKQATELEKANKQIILINSSLEKIVANRTKELVNLNKDLDLLFYHSSHDFKRPLTTLMGLSEIARLSTSNEEYKELFEKVNDTALSMDKLQQKFFMLYRIRHYRKAYESNSLEEIIETLKVNLISKSKNIRFSQKIELESYPAKDERNYLIQVILKNLIENSIIYNRKDQKIIELEISDKDNMLHISLFDNGDGIQSSFHDKVYNMYFRGSVLANGNGLGLYVVKKVIDVLKANIDLESKEGEFTRFTICFKI